MTEQTNTTAIGGDLPPIGRTFRDSHPVDAPGLTMSSLEIAGLTGKTHANVCRDVRQMLISLYGEDHVAETVPNQYRNRHSEYVRENASAILDAIFPSDHSNWNDPGRGFKWERDVRGYVTAFYLDRAHSFALVSGYDVKIRKRIIDRWLDLEAAVARPTVADVPADLRSEIDRTFGICKMLSSKVTEIERAIPIIVGQTVERAIATDPRRAVLDYVSARQLVEEAKAMQRGRRALGRKIGNALRERALMMCPPVSLRRCAHSGVWLFPRDFARDYMLAEGMALVADHNAAVNGQGVLRLVRSAT